MTTTQRPVLKRMAISTFDEEDYEPTFITDFSETKKPQDESDCESPMPDSLDDIVFSNPDSLDSFKKFRESLMKRVQASADRMPASSSGCPSDQSEVYSIFKDLNDEVKHVNFDTFTDKDGKKLSFFELFMVRYRQVCKDRKTVKVADLQSFTNMLEHTYCPRRQQITSFDNILKF